MAQLAYTLHTRLLLVWADFPLPMTVTRLMILLRVLAAARGAIEWIVCL